MTLATHSTAIALATTLTIVSPAHGQVWGSVVDSAGRPPARFIMVDVTGPGFIRRSAPDGQGRFVVWDAPAGHRLTVQVLDDRGSFSARRTVVAPDTVPPIVFPIRRESRGLRVDSAYFTRDVRDRDPTQRNCLAQQCAATYRINIGKVYFWTVVRGAATPRKIRHVWYWEGQEMARVDLIAQGPSWRTWSSKQIDPSWNGHWRIDVLADDGTLLITRDLRIRSDRDTIGPAELRRIIPTNVYDAIFYLRPGWFTGEANPNAQLPGEPAVYVNGVLKGQGWIATHDIPLAGVRLIRRLPATTGDPVGGRVEIRVKS